MFFLIFYFRCNILWCVRIFFTMFKKLFRKQFNFSKIRFINFLLSCPLCLIIIYIGVFDIYIHFQKILRWHVDASIASCNINWCFGIYTFFYINIIRVFSRFFRNFSASIDSSILSWTLSGCFVQSSILPISSSSCLSGFLGYSTSSSCLSLSE